MRIALRLSAVVLPCALAMAPICAGASARRLLVDALESGRVQAPASEAQAAPQPADFAERQGPFSIGDRQYTVVLHEKVLAENGHPPANEGAFLATLAGLDILDANGHAVYQETFPFALANERFSQTLAASASLFSGQGGMALVIQFIEQLAPTDTEGAPVTESWQIFGLVDGQLTQFGPVLPLGQGQDIAVGGVVTALMAQGGIVVVPLASAAEELQVRAWTGNFYALVPMRVDWAHAQWGEGEECYELADGSLRERGCTMPVEAQRAPAPGSSPAFVPLFASTDGKEPQEVPVTAGSRIDFLEALATVRWKTTAGRAECSFDNLWLRVRIDGKEGWVRGQESFDALGLPQIGPR